MLEKYKQEIQVLAVPEQPKVTVLGPGPLTPWELSKEEQKKFSQYTEEKFGFKDAKSTEGYVHRHPGIRAKKTTGAKGLFRETIKTLKEVANISPNSKIIFMEGGHNAANIGHANLFATEPHIPVVAIAMGGFSGEVWAKDLKDYERKKALDKVIIVQLADNESPTAEDVKKSLKDAGTPEGSPFNITFTCSETSTSVMIPKENMIDILNLPGRKRAFIDASSGLMVHEIPGMDGVNADGVTKDGLTRGVSVFATGQKGLRIETDYTAFILCKEDLDILEPQKQAEAWIPTPKATRIEKKEADAGDIKRSSRVSGCYNALEGLHCMKLMQERGHDHIQQATERSQYVKDAVENHPHFDFFVPNPKARGTYNIVINSTNPKLGNLKPEQRLAIIKEAHELLADEDLLIDIKPYGNRGDFRFTTLDIESPDEAKRTLNAIDYAIEKSVIKLQHKTFTLIAEDQFLYANDDDVETAIQRKTVELAKQGITFIDAREWGNEDDDLENERPYTRLDPGQYVIYAPQLNDAQLIKACQYMKLASTLPTSLLVAAREVPKEAEADIIGREGTGVNNINREHARAKGNLVINCPGVNSEVTSRNTLNAVVNHPHIQHFSDKAFSGQASALNLKPVYGPSPEVDMDALNKKLEGKIVTVLGSGDIGQLTIWQLLETEAAEIRVYSKTLSTHFNPEELNLLKKNFPKLTICADINAAVDQTNMLINHLPLNSETKNLITAKQLNQMADGAEIIDAARPEIINIKALIAALDSGKLSRLVVDFDTPDKHPGNEELGDLFEYAQKNPDTCLYSPHAWADTDPVTRLKMLDEALARIDEIYSGVVHNFAGLGKTPETIGHPVIQLEDKGKLKPAGMEKSFIERLRESLQVKTLVTEVSQKPVYSLQVS